MLKINQGNRFLIRRMSVLFLVPIVFLLIMGCGAMGIMHPQTGQPDKPLEIGMTKSEVISIAGDTGCVKTRQRADGTYELWNYAAQWCHHIEMKPYVLIFKDGKLIEIRIAQDESDLQF